MNPELVRDAAFTWTGREGASRPAPDDASLMVDSREALGQQLAEGARRLERDFNASESHRA